MDIIRKSSLWETLSTLEKVEAISYAMEASGATADHCGDGTADISDLMASEAEPDDNGLWA
ncbi:MAG: hypothetical protein Kow0025_17130 [Thermodesulfovibrionales bacterium]